MTSFYSANRILSFGGSGDKQLTIFTNEDNTTTNKILVAYFTGAGGLWSSSPFTSTKYFLGNAGFYTVNGLSDDPNNLNLAYVFLTN